MSESMADEINNHLKNNGVVMVSTYGRATQYEKKHAGMFAMKSDGNLYVRRGKRFDCLTTCKGKMLLVSIKFYS
jgi:hypothetical protein